MSPSSAVQRALFLLGTSIADISGYTGPIKKFKDLWGPTKLGHLSDEKFSCGLEFSKCPYDVHIIPYEVPVIRRETPYECPL